MTIKELKELLEQYDDSLPVYTVRDGHVFEVSPRKTTVGYNPVTGYDEPYYPNVERENEVDAIVF